MKELVRKDILGITPYIPGKPIEETKRELGLKEAIKLASNENPLGPSPKAKEAIKKSLSSINRYPDGSCYYLKKCLGKYYNLSPASFVVGNGSDELIDVIIKTFVNDDENIVTSDVTFVEYEIIAKVNGRHIKTVPLKYFKYDLSAIRKNIDAKTKLVFIANPNNPTGTYVTEIEMEEFLEGLPKQVIVVLDEAYDNFIDVEDFPNSLSYLRRKRDKIIVLKTFSKAYGLAGVRIGYAILEPQLACYMERVRPPFNVNSLAQSAATAALNDKNFLKRSRKIILEGKQYLYDELKKMGVGYVPSVANFILIDVGRDGVTFFKEMLKYGVIVRDMSQYGLKTFIRVTIGTKKENKKFIEVFKKIFR